MAGLAVGAIGLAAFTLRDPPDSPHHIARECRFIAAVEAKRMVWRDEGGPVPFEIWRANDRTSGAARPDLERWDHHLPWQTALAHYLAPKDLGPIDCGHALRASGSPQIIKHNEGPTRQIDKSQYSRVTFSPGDRFALARETSCWLDDNGWDEESRIYIWRRDGETWTIISDTTSLAVYDSPRFKPPMRCFERPVY